MSEYPVRVLHIIPTTAIGGISTFITNLYRQIDRTKVQFDFVAFNKGILHDEILSLGGRVFYFDLIKKQGPFSYMKKLRQIIDQYGPYIAIHSHQGYKAGFSLYAAKLQGIDKRICHIHAIKPEIKWHNIILSPLKLFAIRNATRLIACSKAAGSFMYGRREFEIIPNSIDVNKFLDQSENDKMKFRHELNISDETLVVGHVGRFSIVKNHTFMISIAEELRKLKVNFCMVLVGEGPLRQEIENQVIDKKLEKNIIFLNQRNDINRVMNSIDVFICPSFFESFSIVLLEAQASGTPCIASTGVPNEVDIGVDLLKFIELEKGAEEWAKMILLQSRMKKIDKKKVREALISYHFDTISNTNILLELYKG